MTSYAAHWPLMMIILYILLVHLHLTITIVLILLFMVCSQIAVNINPYAAAAFFLLQFYSFKEVHLHDLAK